MKTRIVLKIVSNSKNSFEKVRVQERSRKPDVQSRRLVETVAGSIINKCIIRVIGRHKHDSFREKYCVTKEPVSVFVNKANSVCLSFQRF